MKLTNCIVIFTIGIAFGMADLAFAQRYRHAHRKPPPSDCIAARGVTNFASPRDAL
jgi:hypothetical protein